MTPQSFRISNPRKGTETSTNRKLNHLRRSFRISNPRKGTETLDDPKELPIDWVSAYLIPARGLKPAVSGDSCFFLLRRFRISNPRKGTET